MRLTPGLACSLAGAASRQLFWGQPRIAREAASWASHAERIPDTRLRDAALSSLRTKRGHTDGAGLFTILPRRRDARLLRLLVAYEILWDYLDSVHELAPSEANGRQLHLALADAVDPAAPVRDYYRFNPSRQDAGYLTALVTACQTDCAALPAFETVREALAQEARRAQVLALNHIIDAADRDEALRRWAQLEFGTTSEIRWFELSGAASASVLVHALFALGADPTTTRADVAGIYRVYWPWVSLATTMLDSWVDRYDDARNGDHSYVAHYPDPHLARDGISRAIDRAAVAARSLRRADRHAVILASMCAMYLSKDSARRDRIEARELAQAGGQLTRFLLPVLRVWRIRYGQASY